MNTTRPHSLFSTTRLARAARRTTSLLLAGAALAIAPLDSRAASATPPDLMAYQGFLVDANGNPLANTTPLNYPAIFRIYTASQGGTRLWSEQQVVTVDKGNFSVLLGQGTQYASETRPALSSVMGGADASDLYVGVTVTIDGSSQEILPRLRLLPSPYAFLATSANNVVSPAGVPVIRYGNSRVEVTGDIAASGVISGNGSGLTDLTAAQVTGVFADNQLPANVARRDVGNAFTGNQTISGNVGIGTVGTTFPLTIGNNSTGDKLSLWGQSGNSFGFGVAPSLLQIHTDIAGSDIAFGYGSSAAMTETMRIKGNGNVGIGNNKPGAKLTVNGGVQARGGAPAAGAGYAFTGNGGDNDSGMFSSADGQVEFYGNNVERMRIASSGAVGINTPTPTATLDVNGSIKANSVTVNGTVSATTFTGTFNGEKPPQTYTVGPGLNLNSWRDVLIDATALFNDADGGRFKVLMRNHGDLTMRIWNYDFFAETDAENFNRPGVRGGLTVNNVGGETYFILGTTARYDIHAVGNWFWLRNYRTGLAFGGTDGPAFTAAADRYKFWFLVPPNMTATVILYDR